MSSLSSPSPPSITPYHEHISGRRARAHPKLGDVLKRLLLRLLLLLPGNGNKHTLCEIRTAYVARISSEYYGTKPVISAIILASCSLRFFSIFDSNVYMPAG
eukprot:1285761-Amorphochlora_amoeboformis.AAC.1